VYGMRSQRLLREKRGIRIERCTEQKVSGLDTSGRGPAKKGKGKSQSWEELDIWEGVHLQLGERKEHKKVLGGGKGL